MIVRFTDQFRKQYKKSNVRIRNRFNKQLALFTQNPHEPQLNNHALRDEWKGYRSINVTADWRAIFKEVTFTNKELTIYFEALGPHKDLYK